MFQSCCYDCQCLSWSVSDESASHLQNRQSTGPPSESRHPVRHDFSPIMCRSLRDEWSHTSKDWMIHWRLNIYFFYKAVFIVSLYRCQCQNHTSSGTVMFTALAFSGCSSNLEYAHSRFPTPWALQPGSSRITRGAEECSSSNPKENGSFASSSFTTDLSQAEFCVLNTETDLTLDVVWL